MARVVEVFDRYHVTYLLVGGVACNAHGAQRPTRDFDCLVERTGSNLTHLSSALGELNARLRVEGMTDKESQQLPTRLDATMLGRMELATLRTDAGDVDVLNDMPRRDGCRLRYHDLAPRAVAMIVESVSVRLASLEDLIASKEWANRPNDHDALPELYALRERAGPSPSPSAADDREGRS